MDIRTEELLRFLDSAHSMYHAVRSLTEQLEQAGYVRLLEQEAWRLVPGGKYYMTRGGSTLLAFRVPEQQPKGFLISASHSDRPTFKIKENGELVGAYTRLSTEKYGSLLVAPWLDRPLSIAGQVMVETENGVVSRLVDVDRDLLLIPNVAIHMNRKANDGYAWNAAVDTLPLLGSKDAAGKLNALLEAMAGGKILGHDLYLYIRQKAAVWGLEEAFLSSAGLDDLECAWCCTQGFLKAEDSGDIPVLCVFDSEEVGSGSVQGAGSTVLEDVLTRICEALAVNKNQLFAASFMVSADNGHALHPNHPEYADAANAPIVNGGVVLKFNAAQHYTTDGVASAIFRKVCGKAGVPVQTYYNRADIPGGSTLGRISLGHVSVPTADVGLPQLAMHSCYETGGVKDAIYLQEAMTAYYGCTLTRTADGYFFE